jgi:sulfatase maturation enzyme AslB (radical SAM superfamily)
MSTFEYVVDDYVDVFGSVDMVDMTPIAGELTLTPDWLKMLEYLYDKDEVVRFEYVTNFLDYDLQTLMKLLKFSDKFGLFISVYGYDRESFVQSTGVDKWDEFIESITNLQQAMLLNKYECFPITFYFRGVAYEDIPHNMFISKFLKALKIVSKGEITFDSSMANLNFNWAGQMEVPNPVPAHVRVGADTPTCLHAIIQNCVLPDGDITLCGMVDVNRKMIIGNIFNQSLKEIYGKGSLYASYIEHNHPLCSKCTEYESKHNEPEDVKTHENKLDKIR